MVRCVSSMPSIWNGYPTLSGGPSKTSNPTMPKRRFLPMVNTGMFPCTAWYLKHLPEWSATTEIETLWITGFLTWLICQKRLIKCSIRTKRSRLNFLLLARKHRPAGFPPDLLLWFFSWYFPEFLQNSLPLKTQKSIKRVCLFWPLFGVFGPMHITAGLS
ncbi:hypothetical protein LCGC14_2747120 [marine sediment metagenome]|uniref:Uncharacterized protein n=1 Tax=marine sediment metagenome TaxID=412755 RepID=A0A0F8VZG9_9ZZZZ